jgi:hypothetical protein
MSSLSWDEAARTLTALLKSQSNKEPPLYLNQVEMRELQWLSDRPAGSLLHIREPRVVIERPEAKLFIPRDVWLWVAKSCRTELRPWDAEPYEDYRVRLAEEAALGVYRRNHSSVADRLRKSRGKALALDLRIQHIGFGIWYVPSSGAGTLPRPYVHPDAPGYDVDMNRGTCTCPDYDRRRAKCKHQYAVEYLQAAQATPERGYTWVGTRSGRFSSKRPNLSASPSTRHFTDAEYDFSALEKRVMDQMNAGIQYMSYVHKDVMKQLVGRTVRFRNGAKVEPFIHDELVLEVAVAPPTPADAITLKVTE